MAILGLAACIKKVLWPREICVRAVRGLFDEGQLAEISSEQWLKALIPVIAGHATPGRPGVRRTASRLALPHPGTSPHPMRWPAPATRARCR